jgi:Uma2 family endonuclease
MCPEPAGKIELIDTELIEVPPATFSRSKLTRRCYELLLSMLPSSRVWLEVAFRAGAGWLQPNVSVTWPDQPIEDDYLAGAPMIALEVLSPRTTASEIERKLTRYLNSGSSEVWVVDPKQESLTIYRRVAEGEMRIRLESSYQSVVGVTIHYFQIFD